jgi:shikimate kinase
MASVRKVRVLLVGMMGAGKTTVGRALAARLGWPYLDNDELVERTTGRTAKELLGASVSELRKAESAALTEALREAPPLVATVPGGVVENASDRTRLRRGGFVIWLRTRVPTLVERLGRDLDRPWLQPDPAAALHRLYAGRKPKYAEVAALVIDVDELVPEDVVDRVVAELETDAEEGSEAAEFATEHGPSSSDPAGTVRDRLTTDERVDRPTRS